MLKFLRFFILNIFIKENNYADKNLFIVGKFIILDFIFQSKTKVYEFGIGITLLSAKDYFQKIKLINKLFFI